MLVDVRGQPLVPSPIVCCLFVFVLVLRKGLLSANLSSDKWPVSLKDPPISVSPASRLQVHACTLRFVSRD